MQKLKTRLEVATGKKVKVDGKTAKVHVKELDGTDMFILANICGDLKIPPTQMKAKRSGTGITVIITVK